MKLLVLIFLSLFNSLTLAQYEYQLNGSYEIKEGKKSNPVEFSLRWSEKNNLISGHYKDNHYAEKGIEASGSVDNLGRLFKVKLPNERGGVQSISVLTSQKKIDDTATSVPISVITRDSEGSPVTTKGIAANLVGLSTVAQRQEEPCEEEFGALAGFCGIYEGVISEEFDPADDCDLMTRPAIRLELNPEGSFLLHLDRLSEIVETPYHAIGRIRANPESTLVDVLSRTCRSLEGIDYPGDNCKRLNLRGSFTSEGDDRSFEGTYTIVDELTDRRCRYRLSVESR
jgi:hypothetical protein